MIEYSRDFHLVEENKIISYTRNIVQSDYKLLPGSHRLPGHDGESAQQRAVQEQHLPDPEEGGVQIHRERARLHKHHLHSRPAQVGGSRYQQELGGLKPTDCSVPVRGLLTVTESS